jgi:hypothetical protein
MSILLRPVELWSIVRIITNTSSLDRGLLTPRHLSSQLWTKTIHSLLGDIVRTLLAQKGPGHVPGVVQSTSTSSTNLTIVKLLRTTLRTRTPIPIFARPGLDHVVGRMNQISTTRRMLWPSAMQEGGLSPRTIIVTITRPRRIGHISPLCKRRKTWSEPRSGLKRT